MKLPARTRFAVFSVLAVALLTSVALLLLTGLRRADQLARMYAIGGALHAISSYDEVVGHQLSPIHRSPDGEPLSSWRFAVINCLEVPSIGDSDARWDSPPNAWAASFPCYLYCFRDAKDPKRRCDTNVLLLCGPGTAFDGVKRRLSELPAATALLIETSNSGVHWMAPGDADVSRLEAIIAANSGDDGFCVAFADDSVWLLRSDTPAAELKKFCYLEEVTKWNRDEVLAPFVIRKRTSKREQP